ncbi:MAG TPA: DUF1622 domain-containing protein [Thermomicrobiales bacterium]|nr:DUF1622 domain-containing protein [Thermomicrobiales bacterium]
MEAQPGVEGVDVGRVWVERAASGIELLAVTLIVLVIAYATVSYVIDRYLRQTESRRVFDRYRSRLGQGLLLGLEILVAADVVRTVALAPTLQNVIVLGLLVVIRTFLSWSLVVELDGHWPWQESRKRAAESETGGAPV